MTDRIDQAISLFEHGKIKKAGRLLASIRQTAADANDHERLADLEEVTGQMRAHLTGEESAIFEGALSSKTFSPTTVIRRSLPSSGLGIAFAIVAIGPMVLFYGLDFRLFLDGAGGNCWDMKYSQEHGTYGDPLLKLAALAPLLAGGMAYVLFLQAAAPRSGWRFLVAVPVAVFVTVLLYLLNFAGTVFVDYCTS